MLRGHIYIYLYIYIYTHIYIYILFIYTYANIYVKLSPGIDSSRSSRAVPT